MSRGVIELADYNTMGTLPLPAKAIPNFDPYDYDPTFASMFPGKTTLGDYHRFLFRVKRLKIRDLIYSTDTPYTLDFTPYLQTTFRNYTWKDSFGGVPDERALLLYPGMTLDPYDLYDNSLHSTGIFLLGTFNYGSNPDLSSFTEFHPDGSWPPSFQPNILSRTTGLLETTIPAPVIYDPVDQSVWPFVNFTFDFVGGGSGTFWSNIYWSDVTNYTRTVDSVGWSLPPMSTAPVALYKYAPIPPPFTTYAEETITCSEGNLRLETVEYFERRDANGQNPIWDATTGEQLIFPIPTNTDR